jgi:hypothetical protein
MKLPRDVLSDQEMERKDRETSGNPTRAEARGQPVQWIDYLRGVSLYLFSKKYGLIL